MLTYNEPLEQQAHESIMMRLINALVREQMHEKVFYTVYQSHLGELIIQLCELYQLDEQQLWKEVAKISEQIITQIAQDQQFVDQAQVDRAALFQSEMSHKALILMRLSP